MGFALRRGPRILIEETDKRPSFLRRTAYGQDSPDLQSLADIGKPNKTAASVYYRAILRFCCVFNAASLDGSDAD